MNIKFEDLKEFDKVYLDDEREKVILKKDGDLYELVYGEVKVAVPLNKLFYGLGLYNDGEVDYIVRGDDVFVRYLDNNDIDNISIIEYSDCLYSYTLEELLSLPFGSDLIKYALIKEGFLSLADGEEELEYRDGKYILTTKTEKEISL